MMINFLLGGMMDVMEMYSRATCNRCCKKKSCGDIELFSVHDVLQN